MMMNMKSKKLRLSVLSTLTLTVLLISAFSTVVSATTFNTAFTKGTEFFQVSTYDESAWQATVSTSSDPSDWFGGDANVTGARSKYTTMGWVSSIWDTYDTLITFFPQIMLVKDLGYNETEINNNFTSTYKLTSCLRSEWYFVSGEFNESYNSATDMPIVLSNPVEYKNLLDDYNEIAYSIQVSSNPSLDLIKSSFQNTSADDFLWDLAMTTLAMGTPISIYIQELVDSLDCENSSYLGTTLIFQKTGETNYSVEITYGFRGTISSFVVKNNSGTVIYQFTSLGDTNWIIYIIAGVIISSLGGLIAYLVYKRKKFNKTRR